MSRARVLAASEGQATDTSNCSRNLDLLLLLLLLLLVLHVAGFYPPPPPPPPRLEHGGWHANGWCTHFSISRQADT